MNKIFNVLMFIIGAFVGVSVFSALLKLTDTNFWPGEELTRGQELGMSFFFAIIFGFLFYRIIPVFAQHGRWLAKMIIQDLRKISAIKLVFGMFGLILGFIIAFLLSLIYTYIPINIVGTLMTIITYVVLGYMGVLVFSDRGRDILNQISLERVSIGKKEKKRTSPKVLDTSVIIDGRILEIMDTGFLEGDIIIPEFVLLELQYIADSADDLKRVRGRRGLDILKQIQDKYSIEIYNTSGEKTIEEIPDVDIKLLKLCQIIKGEIVTNDFNLNKVAKLKDIKVLNINELANAVKPIVLPEETMKVKPVKEGKEKEQALAYLEDGTMIVVEGGRRFIGKDITIKVGTVLQTPAGRMIFGKPEKEEYV